MINWQRGREARQARLAAAASLALGKIVAVPDVIRLLETLIRPGDRVCIEGDNQKQADPLGAAVGILWGHSILQGPVLLHSRGSGARRRFGAGGARIEAARGFPTVYQVGLPALRAAERGLPNDPEAARV